MAFKPNPAGPKTIRELYHWAWNNFTRVAQTTETPGTHTLLTDRDAADQHPISAITDLQTSLDAKVNEGYGGAGADAALSDISVGVWQTMPLDTLTVASSVGVSIDSGADTFQVTQAGVWKLQTSGSIQFDALGSNTVRNLLVRLYNVTDDTTTNGTPYPAARDASVSAIPFSVLLDVTQSNVYRIEISSEGAGFTTVSTRRFSISLTQHAGAGGSAGGGGGGGANTTSNEGGGEGLAMAKAGVNLPFKSLTAGANITLTPSADELQISSVAGGGGARALLATDTDPVAGFFDFDNIPAGYVDLLIVAQLRSDRVATQDTLKLYFNNDLTDTNYHSQYMQGRNGTGLFADESAAPAGHNCPGANSGGNYGDITIQIMNYRGAIAKTAMVSFLNPRTNTDFVIGDVGIRAAAITDPITRIRYQGDEGNLFGTVRLYGITP